MQLDEEGSRYVGFHVVSSGGWVITEQIRTVSADRFRRYAPELALSDSELDEERRALSQMLIT